MAEPITNLTAVWVNNTGIQINWTAATDVTTGSFYTVYVLTGTNQPVPTWKQAAILEPQLSRSPYDAAQTLTLPATSYLYPWASIEALQASFEVAVQTVAGSPAAVSLAFNVVHTDSSGAQSTFTTISVSPPSQSIIYAGPHLTNNINVDSFGQFVVNPQDSYDEIAESVSMLVGTILGSRTMVPTYGIPDLPMTDINLSKIQSAISMWEPRADASVTLNYDDRNEATININLANTPGGA